MREVMTFGLTAVTAGLLLAGCFGCDDDGYYDYGADGGAERARGSSADGDRRTVAAAPSSESGSTTTATRSSDGGSGLCEPNAVCNGLTACRDECYGERCCHLSCTCDSDDAASPSARLRCQLACDK